MIVSIHNYTLAESVTGDDFREVVKEAERRDLFDLPGLVDHQFLRGVKGARKNEFTAVWWYASRDAWRTLWGPVDDPVSKEEYPKKWAEWENQLLATILVEDPDEIEYTTYEVVQPTG